MTEIDEPGYAERDDDEFSEQTGDGVEPADLDLALDDLTDDDGYADDGEEEEI
jgi:hypothetical protein